MQQTAGRANSESPESSKGLPTAKAGLTGQNVTMDDGMKCWASESTQAKHEPDTSRIRAGHETDTRRTRAGDEPETSQRRAGDETETRRRRARHEPETRQTRASDEPETRRRRAGHEPETCRPGCGAEKFEETFGSLRICGGKKHTMAGGQCR
ncbi:hypothetical protein EYF80_019327 [Liparis tanakae]|uniref:Uncharacterized protein n=1 Tax=Liparis tanakae TaxID=230148 RepID=A0A4Z2HY42_9TELE|nr:hypothetical protein EYF80_019327 [Liparis tanakae]